MKIRVPAAHGILAVTFVIFLGLSWLSRHQMIPGGPMVVLFVSQILLSVPSFVYIIVKRLPVIETLRLNPISFEDVKMAVLVIVCTYPLVGVLNFLTMLFVENAVNDAIEYFLPYGLQTGLFMLAFLPAFNEEILCRGMLYHAYSRKSALKGVFLSALVFGLFHMNMNQMPYAILLGIVFALMNEATDSVLTSVLMHFLLNGFNVLMNYVLAARGLMEEEAQAATIRTLISDPEMLRSAVWTSVVCLVAFVPMTIILIRKTFKDNHRKMPANRGRLLDPVILLFLAATMIMTWKNTVFVF